MYMNLIISIKCGSVIEEKGGVQDVLSDLMSMLLWE